MPINRAPTGLLFLLVSMSLMEGLDDEEILDKLRNYYPGILLANWKVWPLLQLFSEPLLTAVQSLK
jgi:hypothetical protein